MQGRHLPQHVHAPLPLRPFIDRHQARGSARLPLDAFGANPEPAEVQPFELGAQFGRRELLAEKLLLGCAEIAVERRRGTARAVSGARFEQYRRFRLECHLLEARHHGAGAHDFVGKEVGGADQDADLDAAFHERLAHGGHHGGAAIVVNAAGEEQVELGRLFLRKRCLLEDAND